MDEFALASPGQHGDLGGRAERWHSGTGGVQVVQWVDQTLEGKVVVPPPRAARPYTSSK